ncbi:3579_t:CDS:2 [Entrophospora sp. SA101]|nr:7010_t:CDS:2 [Entrophospora sp. SA101]CAJ0829939.1 3579_t:CDS:2 [Entrophospora sp. SA101]
MKLCANCNKKEVYIDPNTGKVSDYCGKYCRKTGVTKLIIE